ncbi:LLM class F420-dependent oxidoreductase [Rhodococcus sp. USK10]|uniref:LLM class F420-dependent oxidoreductase n=1 Tax=Rhodococcus sp. USK10 TaxID=2789739 RepID=UPI001C5D93BF|nr:LLM class F420-dependent oxidoreductase [Rhodococcus sp. USK10]QYB07459.1 LLM class F420-dependent oxidoreductase [Rhodococcus sp. USK10]
MFPSADSITPADLALNAERCGFESVFFPDHTHVPLGDGPPGYSGHDVPEFYRTTMDPIVAMTAAATASTRIRIGTAVCLVAQRDPIILAKQIASIDQLSAGRVILGVGAGWNDEEMRNHGTEPSTRFGVLRERVEAMSAIWQQKEASYEGKHVTFDRMWSWPKPVQVPRPPVLVGGGGPKVLDRVLSYGDGWMPFREGTDQVSDALTGAVEEFEHELTRRVARLRRLAEVVGRDRPSVTLFNACPHRAALDRYREMEIDRVVFWLPSLGTDDTVDTLHRLDALFR